MAALQCKTTTKKKQLTKRQRQAQKIKSRMGIDPQQEALAMLNRACSPSPQDVEELCKAEVEERCGTLYSLKVPGRPCRGGSDKVTVSVGGYRVAITKPRMKQNKKELPLNTIKYLHQNNVFKNAVMDHVLGKTPLRQYQPTTTSLIKATGISASTVSRIFQEGCLKSVDTINTRNLMEYEFIAIFIDTIYFGGHALISALGVTAEGQKIFLGLQEGTTENSGLATKFLRNLVTRGLTVDTMRLFVLDGSKALKKAVKDVFGPMALIQRCALHKKRNIQRHIPHEFRPAFLYRWNRILSPKVKDLEEAEQRCEELEAWLEQNEFIAALASFDEGKNDLLSVYDLELSPECRRLFRSSNIHESAVATLRGHTKWVTHWRDPEHVLRWGATVSLRIEDKSLHLVDTDVVTELAQKLATRADEIKLRSAEVHEQKPFTPLLKKLLG